jgi:hypothetical protein
MNFLREIALPNAPIIIPKTISNIVKLVKNGYCGINGKNIND